MLGRAWRGFPMPGRAQVVVFARRPRRWRSWCSSLGGVVTSRGIDAAWPAGEQEGFARRIAVEVKRTWMGVPGPRPNSLPVTGAVVLGDSPICQGIARAVAEAIEVEAPGPWPRSGWGSRSRIGLVRGGDSQGHGQGEGVQEASDQEASGQDAWSLWRWLPLAGAAVASCERIDLLRPKRATAGRSRVRERALLGVMALVAVVGGAGVLGYVRLGEARDQLRASTRREGHAARGVPGAGAAGGPAQAPASIAQQPAGVVGPPGSACLACAGRWGADRAAQRGSSRGGVWFGDPQGRRSYSFLEGQYRPAVRGVLQVHGVGDRRELAGMVRGRLVNDPLYIVQTQGPDAGPAFKLEVELTSRSVARWVRRGGSGRAAVAAGRRRSGAGAEAVRMERRRLRIRSGLGIGLSGAVRMTARARRRLPMGVGREGVGTPGTGCRGLPLRWGLVGWAGGYRRFYAGPMAELRGQVDRSRFERGVVRGGVVAAGAGGAGACRGDRLGGGRRA
ncbi:MAG: hypothetical protein KatS3mg103_0502 [Phycisphaerales bacterium]|nr:MAG: hypothetical protein KatS3mg103_0502 [Phycisphaerales bacterium]